MQRKKIVFQHKENKCTVSAHLDGWLSPAQVKKIEKALGGNSRAFWSGDWQLEFALDGSAVAWSKLAWEKKEGVNK